MAGRRRATCSASRACSRPTRAGGSCRPRPATGWRSGSTPTSSRRRAARSWRPSSGPCRPTTCTPRATPGVDALARAATGDSPDGRDAAAGDDVVPDGRRGRARPPVHRRRRPRRPRHRLQPRHLAHAEPAAGDDRRLPRDAAHARGGARGGDDQRGPRGGRRRAGRVARARQAGGPRRLARRLGHRAPVLGRGEPRGRSSRAAASSTAERRGADPSPSRRCRRVSSLTHPSALAAGLGSACADGG